MGFQHSAPRGDSLADRLGSLVDRYEERTGTKLGPVLISQAIREAGGTVSHGTVATILNGKNTNPSLRTLEELSAFFGVTVAALTGTARRPEHHTLPEKLGFLAMMRRRLLPAEQHSAADVSEILFREHGVRISADNLELLHRDPQADPTKAVLEALARYYGVPASYLLDDGDLAVRVEEQLDDLAKRADTKRALEQAGVSSLAARLGDLHLKPDQVATVLAVVDSLARTNVPRDGQ